MPIVETSALIIFLLITFFGSYIQAVAGFRYGHAHCGGGWRFTAY